MPSDPTRSLGRPCTDQTDFVRRSAAGLRVLVALTLVPLVEVPAAVPNQADMGELRLSVTDAERGDPTPARIELLDASGKAFVADDALLVGPGYQERAVPWQGDFAKAVALLSRKIENPFTQTTQFYTSGASIVTLPPGEYRLRIFKGIEYRLEHREVRIAAGQSAKLEVPLTRWINLPAQGWYSADDHLHISRPVKELDALLLPWMQAEDINVANLLQFGTWNSFYGSPQHAFGPSGVHQEGNYILVSGQENPRTDFMGHTIILGGRTPIQDSERYEIFRTFWQEARQQGALSGYAHWGTGSEGQHGLAVDLPDRLIEFLEVLECWDANYDVWYEILNMGFPMTPTAGTDYGTLPNLPGRERFYTAVRGPLTVASWLDGIRRGATFVTNGPILEFRVNGKTLGEEVVLDRPGVVRVEASVRFDAARDDVFRIEVVQNGTLLNSTPRVGPVEEIRSVFEINVAESCWLAARITGSKVGEQSPPEGFVPPFRNRKRGEPASHAHTASIQVKVAGSRGLDGQTRTRATARIWLARLAELERRMGDDNLKMIARDDNLNRPSLEHLQKIRPELLEAIRRARTYYEGKLP